MEVAANAVATAATAMPAKRNFMGVSGVFDERRAIGCRLTGRPESGAITQFRTASYLDCGMVERNPCADTDQPAHRGGRLNLLPQNAAALLDGNRLRAARGLQLLED